MRSWMNWMAFMVFVGLGCGGGERGADTASIPDAADLDPALPESHDRLASEEVGARTVPYDWCEPDAPPDLPCHAARRDPGSENVRLARRIADRFIASHAAASLSWNWEEAVLMAGVAALHDVTQDPAYLDYVRDWMDHHRASGIAITTSDTCAPAALAAWLFARTGAAAYAEIMDRALAYLEHEAVRTPEGGISHLGVLPYATLWVDSLYMFGSLLSGSAQAQGDPRPLNLFHQQWAIFSRLLQGESGLFGHAAYWTVEPDPPVHWARGNGWAAASACDYLRVRVNRGETDADVEASAGRLLQAIRSAQDETTGLWWTVMDHPHEGYLETSASALFTYALARAYRYGFVTDEVLGTLARAVDGLKVQVDQFVPSDPIVRGTSGPTSPGQVSDYLGVAQVDDLPYGVGAVLLALTETSGLPRPEPKVLPLEPSADSIARKAEYLALCSGASRPGSGRFYGQVCRVADAEESVDEDAIEAACQKLDRREDTADFRAAALVRMLYLDREQRRLPKPVRDRIEQTLLGFKYWLDESGHDQMCYWSENHQILFHSSELLAGQLFADRVFANTGQNGAAHVAHALPLVQRWLDLRGRHGFSEWHSNVYFNEDIPALVNLVDFAEDETVRTKAAMVLDLLAYDFLTNTYRGLFATAHGRTYETHLLGGLDDSTAEAAWLMLGLGKPERPDNFSGAFLATSRYAVPPFFETLARDASARIEHRQRDGFDVADGPALGITYTRPEDIVIWAGMAALAAPPVIAGTLQFVEDYDLWDGFLFGDIPAEYKDLIRGLVGTPGLEELARELEPVSRGIALEAMSTYTYRTPDYQLSGAQDYHAGMWGAQTFPWIAALDRDAFVFTSVPGNFQDLVGSLEFGTAWVGGWIPRVTLYRNVGVIQYRIAEVPLVGPYLTGPAAHAFVPRSGFDEVRTVGQWVFARKGDGYVGLWASSAITWAENNDYELIAEDLDTTWVVELGRRQDDGSFEAFVAARKDLAIEVGQKVVYPSPSLGTVEVGWTGPMTVAGRQVDLGPYPRWDNAMSRVEAGSAITRIEYGGRRLELDFATPARRLFGW